MITRQEIIQQLTPIKPMIALLLHISERIRSIPKKCSCKIVWYSTLHHLNRHGNVLFGYWGEIPCITKYMPSEECDEVLQ